MLGSVTTAIGLPRPKCLKTKHQDYIPLSWDKRLADQQCQILSLVCNAENVTAVLNGNLFEVTDLMDIDDVPCNILNEDIDLNFVKTKFTDEACLAVNVIFETYFDLGICRMW